MSRTSWLYDFANSRWNLNIFESRICKTCRRSPFHAPNHCIGWYSSKLAAATSGAQVFPSKSPILNDSLEIEFIRKSKINRWAVPRWWKYLKHFTFTMRKHVTTLWASQIGISRFVFSMNSQWIHWKWVLDGLEWRSVVAAPDVGPHQWILRFRLHFFYKDHFFVLKYRISNEIPSKFIDNSQIEESEGRCAEINLVFSFLYTRAITVHDFGASWAVENALHASETCWNPKLHWKFIHN